MAKGIKEFGAKRNATYAAMMAKTKEEVFRIYAAKFLGRVHSSDKGTLRDMRKSWMAYDIAASVSEEVAA